MLAESALTVPHFSNPLSIHDLDATAWSSAAVAHLTRYWSGQPAPPSRHAEARLLWTDEALYVRCAAQQHEPLHCRSEIDTTRKTMNLWDWDVCEIFLAPTPDDPQSYLECEVAPTGEWLDVALSWRNGVRFADWDYRSGMSVAVRCESRQVVLAMRLAWAEAIGRAPQAGEIWRANLLRCVGPLGPERGYLAWQPTFTPQPNFHVPAAFGRLHFSA